jgi:hypothetical protein
MTIKFEVGQEYKINAVEAISVTRRSEVSVWFKVYGKEIRRKIQISGFGENKVEFVNFQDRSLYATPNEPQDVQESQDTPNEPQDVQESQDTPNETTCEETLETTVTTPSTTVTEPQETAPKTMTITDWNATTYWNCKGKYQIKADKIQDLIPLEGACDDPKLEAMRIIINLYYDWHNNALGNDNRVQAFLNNPTLTRELPELTKVIKNDIEFYENEVEQYNFDLDYLEDDEDEPEEPMMIWSDEIEGLLELALDHMIAAY